MAASQHLGIRDAVAALVTGLAAGTGENDPAPVATDQASRVNVKRVRSTPSQPTTSHPIDWDTELQIEIIARVEAVADDLACSCFAAVMADESLGGLATGLQPGGFDWDEDQAETTVHRVTWNLNVFHVTQNNVIT